MYIFDDQILEILLNPCKNVWKIIIHLKRDVAFKREKPFREIVFIPSSKDLLTKTIGGFNNWLDNWKSIRNHYAS